jgi:hypothetical protein
MQLEMIPRKIPGMNTMMKEMAVALVVKMMIEMGVRGCFACPEGTIRAFNVLGRKKGVCAKNSRDGWGTPSHGLPQFNGL